MFDRLKRLYFRKLVVPLVRNQHPPEYTARGAAVGLAWAFTPLVGVQMPLVFGCWLLARRLAPRFDFNLVAALAWTWVTNVFTAPLAYYLFLLTGRLMLGRWDEIRGFEAFERNLGQAVPDATPDGFLDGLWMQTLALFERFGTPMFVGCVPWALIMGWVGYRVSHAVVVRVRARRARRRARGRARGPR